MLPDTKENFLSDIFGLGRIAEHPASKADHAREMPAYEFSRRALVASADTSHQFLVRIPHGVDANSENRSDAPRGALFKVELLSNVMHPAAAFAER